MDFHMISGETWTIDINMASSYRSYHSLQWQTMDINTALCYTEQAKDINLASGATQTMDTTMISGGSLTHGHSMASGDSIDHVHPHDLQW